ncbi:MAG: hypothetical protein ACLRM9_08190 [Collinsella aerofaciens]
MRGDFAVDVNANVIHGSDCRRTPRSRSSASLAKPALTPQSC